jgi:RHS repeat-associated protein
LTGLSASSSAGTPFNIAPNYNNNGEISSITNSVDSGRTQSFTYDALSRVTAGSSSATSGSDCWGQTFTIDNVANLTGMALSQCSGGTLSAAVNGHNQFTTGYTYDAAGNLTGDGLYTYTYNAENEITSANSVSYEYDGKRMRVAKSGGTMYWRDVNGNAIAETNLSGTDVNEYVFFAGRRIARIDSGGNIYYYEADQVGSTRTGTNSKGVLCYDADFTPYGTEIEHTDTCPQNYKFTGYERDSETGLDYAVYRYYNSRVGRFMSPDPAGLTGITDPQSWNRYAYVLNNPLSYTRSSGTLLRVGRRQL